MTALHVVQLEVELDPQGRSPSEIIAAWRDFGRAAAEAVAEASGLRITIVQAAWNEERQVVAGIDCHFVRERVPAWRLPLPLSLSLSKVRRFRRLPRRLLARVRELQPDVVHFSGLGYPREVRALRRLLPAQPIVAQDHASQVPRGWRRPLHRWGLATLDGVMFSAAAQAEPFKRSGVLPPNLPVFEVMEVSSPFQPGDQRAARAQTRMQGDPCLFWLGHLDANKDPLMVLDAVAAAAPSLPALRLYMCFRAAPLLAAVQRRIADDPLLRDRVTLLGEVGYPAIEQYLQSADFLVQASHHEGSGYGVLEALACGVTPLVTDIPAFRRMTGDGRFGALVPVGQPAALAAAIVDWGGRDKDALRRAARAHFDRELSLRAVGRQLRDTYQRVRRLA